VNATVEALQRFLVDHGIDCGDIDGVLGPKTALGALEAQKRGTVIPAAMYVDLRYHVLSQVPQRKHVSQMFGQLITKDLVSPRGGCKLLNSGWLSNLISIPMFHVKRRIHRKVAPALILATAEWLSTGLAWRPKSVQTYPGMPRHICWNPSRALSLHSWGIAIDFDPSLNPMGKRGQIPILFAETMERWGFTWGGRWKGAGRDDMHFEWVR